MNPIKKSSIEHDFCANQFVSVEPAASPFCIGMDLHSDNVVVVIRQTQVGNIHLKGETVFSRAFKINSPSNRLELYKALEPFCALQILQRSARPKRSIQRTGRMPSFLLKWYASTQSNHTSTYPNTNERSVTCAACGRSSLTYVRSPRSRLPICM